MPKKKSPLENQVRAKLKLVLDPELGVSILDMGLIYEILTDQTGTCVITMTLTTAGCPLFGQIQKEIEDRLLEIPEINEVKIDLVFDPPWTLDKMTPEAKAELGIE